MVSIYSCQGILVEVAVLKNCCYITNSFSYNVCQLPKTEDSEASSRNPI